MEIQNEAKESIKLMKMSKSYQWEIKVIPAEGIILSSVDLKRLKEWDNQLKENWGNELP